MVRVRDRIHLLHHALCLFLGILVRLEDGR